MTYRAVFFDAGETLVHPHPSFPELLSRLLARERSGLEPAEAVYVGDNPRFDTEPAEALGMLGVLIDRRDRFPGHDGLRLTTLDDLPAALGLPVAASGGSP